MIVPDVWASSALHKKSGRSLRSRRKHKACGISPRIRIEFKLRAHEMGDSSWPAKSLIFCLDQSIARIRGLEICCALILGLTPQALCFRLLRRLRPESLCKAAKLSKTGESTRIPGTGETRARLFAGKRRVAPALSAHPWPGIA